MINTINTKITKNAGEYRVRLFINNEYQAGADYFTDCKEDATDTAKLMKENGGFSDKSQNAAIEEQADFEEEYGFATFEDVLNIEEEKKDKIRRRTTHKEELYCPPAKVKSVNPAISELTGNIYRYCVEVSDFYDSDSFYFKTVPTKQELINTIGEDLDTSNIEWIQCKVIDYKEKEQDWIECEFSTDLINADLLSIDRFNKILSNNKRESKNGVCVDLLEDENAAKILIETGTGFYTAAVKENGEIVAVSAPSKKDATGTDYLTILFERIFEIGGQWLNCFDGRLVEIYSQLGFKERARVPFNPEFKPAGWNLDERGKPDIVFLRKSKFKSISIPYDSYESAESFLIGGGLVWKA